MKYSIYRNHTFELLCGVILCLLISYSTDARDIPVMSSAAISVSGLIQDDVPERRREKPVKKDSVFAFKERWAIKTNALEWLLTIPNISTEFDLMQSTSNKMTVGLGFKFNWDTWHKYEPSCVYNLMDIRPQFRYYWRSSERRNKVNHVKPLEQRFLEYVVDHERVNPKPWRASYIGAYTNFSTYAFKFGKTGIQGWALGLGATLGYGLPMYTYKKGCVDVDLGFSFGFQFTKYDRFGHDKNGYFYTKIEDGSKPFHFTPFPIVSELSVAFAYRFKSIQDKYPYDADAKKKRQTDREDARSEKIQLMQMTAKEKEAYYEDKALQAKKEKMSFAEQDAFDEEQRKLKEKQEEEANDALRLKLKSMSAKEKRDFMKFERARQVEDERIEAEEKRQVMYGYERWKAKEDCRVAVAGHRHQIRQLKNELALKKKSAKKANDKVAVIEEMNDLEVAIRTEKKAIEKTKSDYRMQVKKLEAANAEASKSAREATVAYVKTVKEYRAQYPDKADKKDKLVKKDNSVKKDKAVKHEKTIEKKK